MKKLILGLLLLTCSVYAGDVQQYHSAVLGMYNAGGGAAPPALTWDNITFFLNFEAADVTGDYNMATTSCGSVCEYSPGDTSGAYTGCTLANVGSVGDYSLRVDSDGDIMAFATTNGVEVDGTVGSIGLLWRHTEASWGSGYSLFRVRSGANYHSIALLTAASGELTLRIYNGGNNDYTSTTADMVVNTWYGITVTWDYTNDVYKVYVNDSEVIAATDAYTNFGATELHIGAYGTTYRDFDYDTVVISDHAENLNAHLGAAGYGE